MKNILALFMILFAAQVVYATEDECPSAVDAAEAQNHNAYKNCDYSKTGLNGVLHRALAKTSESGEDNKEEKENKSNAIKTAADKNQKAVTKLESLNDGEFGSAQQLQSVRFVLLEKLALECANGFVVEGERYSPVINSKVMKLELVHHCL